MVKAIYDTTNVYTVGHLGIPNTYYLFTGYISTGN
jgi:hypothetical protein